MPSFTVQIKNFGKLGNFAEATINVGRLTVLAGVNNVGKSFFSKAMYSAFNVMNSHPVEIAVNNKLNPLRNQLSRLNRLIHDREQAASALPNLESMSAAIKHAAMVAASCPLNGDSSNEHLLAPYPDLEQATKAVGENFARFKPELEAWIPTSERSTSLTTLDQSFIERMEQRVSSLCAIGQEGRQELISHGLSLMVSDQFRDNFQVENLSDLKGAGEGPPTIDIVDVGTFTIQDDDMLFEVTHVGLLALQKLSKVIYLESPVLWKLKPGLLRLRRRNFNEVPAVPGYFYDLADALGKTYQGDPIALEEIRLLSNSIVRGKVTYNRETGELLFNEADRASFRLPVVATGVANLGILAMLVEQKVVDKDALLFIDEPEAHLHPKWQVEMGNLLFALARDGAHVVIATHSLEIIRWLKAHTDRHPEYRELIELNLFTGKEGVMSDGMDLDEKFRVIKEELSSAFLDRYASYEDDLPHGA